MSDETQTEPTTDEKKAPKESDKSETTKEAKTSSRDLKTDLNQLWKTTVDQFDEMKDLIVRSSTAGKARFDATLERRHREKVVLELGERVLTALAEGDLELPKKFSELVATIHKHDDDIAQHEEGAQRTQKTAARDQKASNANADEGKERSTESEETPEVVDAKIQSS